MSDLGFPLVEMLDPRPGERVLDLGCGDGALTEKLAALGCEVVGVDASPEQVAAARARGLDARVMDGQALAFEAEFDAVFSNAALHWMGRAEAVIDGMWRALRPGGRLAAELGGRGNVAQIRSALGAALRRRGVDARAADPWYFPTAEAYRALLEARGFEVRSAELFERPTPLPGDILDWLATFAGAFITVVSPAEQPAFLHEIREVLSPSLRDRAGVWTVDYVRLRVSARRPA